MANSHLIYRQTLEISFPSKKEAMNGQNTISQLYRHDLLPLINEIFDDTCDTPQHVRIDRLEIDLGAVSSYNLKEDFKKGLRKQLEDELLKNMQGAHQPHHPKSDPSNDTSVTSGKTSDRELFIFFVKTGQLPWWAGETRVQSFEKLALKLLSEQPDVLSEVLLALLRYEQYRKRIIYQLPDEILQKFIELKQPWIAEQVTQLHQDLYRIHQYRQIIPLNRANFRFILWEFTFEFWLFQPGLAANKNGYGNAQPSEIQSYLLHVTDALVSKSESYPDRGKSFEHQTIKSLIQTLRGYTIDLNIQDNPLGKMLSHLNELPTSDLEETMEDEKANQIKNQLNVTDKDAEMEAQSMLSAEDAFEIHNAGLVILAPFLPRFFNALGLVDRKEFVTDQTAERAALLLQYVVTKKTEMREYDLLLNKLLCGLAIDAPLPRSFEISDIEKKEVENLLRLVVEHWKALKNTSAEALRQTFLVKDGMLSEEMNGWKLTVERSAVDVLLDKLPWGISIIKLPWTNEIIYVEW